MIAQLRTRLRGQTIAGDAARIYGLQFAGLGLSLITGVLVAQALGPAGKGQVDLFVVLTTLTTQLALLGADSGLLYRLTRGESSLAEVHGSALVIAWGIGALSALLGLVALPVWRALVPGVADWAIVLAFGMTPILLYRAMFSSIVIGINRAPAGYLLDAIMAVVALGATAALWAADELTPTTAVVVTAATLAIDGILAVGLLLRRERRIAPRLPVARAALGFGFVVYVGALANLLHFRIDQVMINGAMGTAAVGVYSVSARWAELLFFLDTAISTAALYRVASSERHASWALTKRLARIQLAITLVAGAALAAIAPWLFEFLYGEQFDDAALPLALLMPGIVAWSSAKLVSNMLTYNLGRARITAAASVAGLLLNGALNAVGLYVLDYGLEGVAIASSVSYIAVIGVIVVIARRIMRAPPPTETA